MTAILIAIHVIACILLIGIILIQAGRGGGLVEGFSGVESMFGTKTNTFLTRTTTVLSVVFFITCLSLALLSVQQSRSLMQGTKPAPAKSQASEQKPVATQKESAKEEKTAPAPAAPTAPSARTKAGGP